MKGRILLFMSSCPDAYRMAFIASGGVEKMVTQHFELLPYPIHLLTDGQQNSLAASLEIATWIRSKGMKVHIIHGTIPNLSLIHI